MSLSQEQTIRLELLITKLTENALAEDEAAELSAMIASSADARRIYMQSTSVRLELIDSLTEADVPEATAAKPTARRSARKSKRLRAAQRRGRSAGSIFAYIAVPLAAAAAALLMVRSSPEPTKRTPVRPAIAEIVTVDGEALTARGPERPVLQVGDQLRAGDRVSTGTNGRIVLLYGDGTTVEAFDDADLELDVGAADAKRVTISAGRVFSDVAKQKPSAQMILATPHGSATVLGTRFSLDVGDRSTRLDVERGSVRLTDASGASVVVAGGETAEAGPGIALVVRSIKPAKQDAPAVAEPVHAKPTQAVELPKPTPAAPKRPIVLYTFDEGRGDVIRDRAGVGEALDLHIGRTKNAAWLPGGGLRVKAPAQILSTTPAGRITRACMQTKEIAVELWIRPLSISLLTRKIGMARILTLSTNMTTRNFSIGMGEMDHPRAAISVRHNLTRGSSGQNGLPTMVSPHLDEIVEHKLIHVVYARTESGRARIWVNGRVVSEQNMPGGYAGWNFHRRLALAQEVVGSDLGRGYEGDHRLTDPTSIYRAWQGEFHRVAIYDRALTDEDVTAHFAAGHRPTARKE